MEAAMLWRSDDKENPVWPGQFLSFLFDLIQKLWIAAIFNPAIFNRMTLEAASVMTFCLVLWSCEI